MPDTITFGNVTIWECGNMGAGWEFIPSSIQEEVIEAVAPIGDGYWLKRAGKRAADHVLNIKWIVDDPADIISEIEDIDQMILATLSLPLWGSYSNCRLASIGPWQIQMKADQGYLISNTLTFRQYP